MAATLDGSSLTFGNNESIEGGGKLFEIIGQTTDTMIDALEKNGIYYGYVPNNSSNTAPFKGRWMMFIVLILGSSTQNMAQIAFAVEFGKPKIYKRNKSSGTWGSWELYVNS